MFFFKKCIILGWDSFLSQEDAGISLQELISSDHHHVLDRSFTVRFRCLLDNTSGFLVSFFSSIRPNSNFIFLYYYKIYFKFKLCTLINKNAILLVKKYLPSTYISQLTINYDCWVGRLIWSSCYTYSKSSKIPRFFFSLSKLSNLNCKI